MGSPVNIADAQVIYGIKTGTDNKPRDIWDVKDAGQVTYDDDFDMTSVEAQTHLSGICAQMVAEYNGLTLGSTTNCWLSAFATWVATQDMTWNGVTAEVESTGNSSNGTQTATWMFPIDLQNFYDATAPATTKTAADQRTLFNDLVCRFVHGSTGFFTTYATVGEGFDYYEVNQHLDMRCYADTSLNEMKYTMFSADIPVAILGPRTIADTMQAKWESYMVEEVNGEGCTSKAYCHAIHWGMRWGMNSGYDALVKAATEAVAFTIPMIFVFLLVLLHNWVIALICVYLICLIMLSVLWMTWVMGWDYGFAESTSTIMVVGFAVDYTVHSAHGYLSAIAKDRKSRTVYTMFQNGHSVVSGAVASFLAAIPLIGQSFNILNKTAVLILCTVSFSALFSLTMLPICLLFAGPEGDAGNIDVYYKSLWRKRTGKGPGRGTVSQNTGLTGNEQYQSNEDPNQQTEFDLN